MGLFAVPQDASHCGTVARSSLSKKKRHPYINGCSRKTNFEADRKDRSFSREDHDTPDIPPLVHAVTNVASSESFDIATVLWVRHGGIGIKETRPAVLLNRMKGFTGDRTQYSLAFLDRDEHAIVYGDVLCSVRPHGRCSSNPAYSLPTDATGGTRGRYGSISALALDHPFPQCPACLLLADTLFWDRLNTKGHTTQSNTVSRLETPGSSKLVKIDVSTASYGSLTVLPEASHSAISQPDTPETSTCRTAVATLPSRADHARKPDLAEPSASVPVLLPDPASALSLYSPPASSAAPETLKDVLQPASVILGRLVKAPLDDTSTVAELPDISFTISGRNADEPSCVESLVVHRPSCSPAAELKQPLEDTTEKAEAVNDNTPLFHDAVFPREGGAEYRSLLAKASFISNEKLTLYYSSLKAKSHQPVSDTSPPHPQLHSPASSKKQCAECGRFAAVTWTGPSHDDRFYCNNCAFICLCRVLTPYNSAYVNRESNHGPYCSNCWKQLVATGYSACTKQPPLVPAQEANWQWKMF